MKKNRQFMRWSLAWLTFFMIVTGCWGHFCWNHLPGSAAIAHSPAPSQVSGREGEVVGQSALPDQSGLLEQGQQYYAAGEFTTAAHLWQQAADRLAQQGDVRQQAIAYHYLAIVYQDLDQWDAAQTAIDRGLTLLPTINDPFLQAQILNTQGSLQLHTGNAETALETWQRSAVLYRSVNDVTGITLSQINQAQALQTLGFYQQARTTLEQLEQELQAQPDSLLKATMLRSLGATLQRVGDFDRSQSVLQTSLTIAQQFNAPSDIAATLFQLGNTARAQEAFETALSFYEQVDQWTVSRRLQMEAWINRFSLLVQLDRQTEARTLLTELKTQLITVPTSRWAVTAQVNLVEHWMKLERDRPDANTVKEQLHILVKAIQQAEALQDVRSRSYALGELGHLYEHYQQWNDAAKVTDQALQLARKINADEMIVTWEWQQGRILNAQGNVNEAIEAYDTAVTLLNHLRQDLIAMNPDVQFSFREQVEPVYRQYVQLLLTNVDRLAKSDQQKRLHQSRQTIESLELAQLQNFFRETCQTNQLQSIESLDPQAAVIYPIVLNQRLEVILSLPNQPLQHYGTNLTSTAVTTLIDQLRQSLNPEFSATEGLPAAQQLYDWLIRPAEDTLAKAEITTLVFVPDDFLHNLPMAVLHDGAHYLVERYNIAFTPGLQLLTAPTTSRRHANALVGGLSESRQGFESLPAVTQEVEFVADRLSAKILLNETFNYKALRSQMIDYPFSIVHLATHGQFSSKVNETFILTWDGPVNVRDFSQWLSDRTLNRLTLPDRSPPLDLLVLSACQTAKGDVRAPLGLAGIAVRSGARTTIGTLWSVRDDSTALLMNAFYQALSQPETAKAAALRQAQQTLLASDRYHHPYYWAGFTLVGNWQ